MYAWKICPHQWYSSCWKVSHRLGRIPNARRNDIELVVANFGCNFSLPFQRAKERRNPSSYAKVMAVGANATQNGVFGPRTLRYFGMRLESFRAGVTLSRTTSTIDEDITSMRTTIAPHNGSEPVPSHVNHKRSCTSILVEFSDRKHRFA